MSDPHTTSPPGAGPATTGKKQRGSILAKENRRLVIGLLLGALVAVFAVLNLDEVEVNWILGTWSTPLIIVIAVSMVVGAGLGYFVGRRRGAG